MKEATMLRARTLKRAPRSRSKNVGRGRLRPAVESLDVRQLLTAGIIEFPLPVPIANPREIAGDIYGNMWFALHGTNQLGTIDSESYDITTFDLPQSAGPIDIKGMISAYDENMWFDSSVE